MAKLMHWGSTGEGLASEAVEAESRVPDPLSDSAVSSTWNSTWNYLELSTCVVLPGNLLTQVLAVPV